jgi:hypothetical protein
VVAVDTEIYFHTYSPIFSVIVNTANAGNITGHANMQTKIDNAVALSLNSRKQANAVKKPKEKYTPMPNATARKLMKMFTEPPPDSLL